MLDASPESPGGASRSPILPSATFPVPHQSYTTDICSPFISILPLMSQRGHSTNFPRSLSRFEWHRGQVSSSSPRYFTSSMGMPMASPTLRPSSSCIGHGSVIHQDLPGPGRIGHQLLVDNLDLPRKAEICKGKRQIDPVGPSDADHRADFGLDRGPCMAKYPVGDHLQKSRRRQDIDWRAQNQRVTLQESSPEERTCGRLSGRTPSLLPVSVFSHKIHTRYRA